MKKIFFIFLIAAFFLDYSFLPLLQIDLAVGANFVLVVLVVILLKRSFAESVGWILLGGLLLDYVCVTPLGTNVLAFLLVGAGLETFQKKLSTSAPNATSLLFVFFATLILFEGAFLAIAEGIHLAGLGSGPVGCQIKNIPQLLTIKMILSVIGVLVFNFIEKLEWLGGAKSMELKI